MSSIRSESRDRRRLGNAIKDALREVNSQLSLLNHQVGGRLAIKDVDLECLNVISRHGPLSPSALARQTGLHPATMTGIIDRLEKGGWVRRERDPADRRAVLVRAARERGADVLGLYAGMNIAMDEVLAQYSAEQLEVLVDFLGRTAAAGRVETERLTEPG